VRAAFIVNPAADGGRTARRWPELRRRAERLGLEPDVRVTGAPGEAELFAREAIGKGVPLIVAVGGDGTVSDVVNGFFEDGRPLAPAAELAVIARGSGCDLIRTFGIPRRAGRALEVAARGRTRRIDVGLVRFRTPDGRDASRHFANVASAGMTGLVAERANRSRKPLGATVAFAWAALAAFAGHRNSRFRISVDGESRALVANNVIVANCRYFASGMKIVPQAEPDDGLLDVLIWGDVSRADLLWSLHRLYRGTHTSHPKAEFLRGRHVSVEPERPLPVEADGEQPGTTPASFEVLPGALRLRVPR
jgi:diacylglycerol kinase (ATP)